MSGAASAKRSHQPTKELANQRIKELRGATALARLFLRRGPSDSARRKPRRSRDGSRETSTRAVKLLLGRPLVTWRPAQSPRSGRGISCVIPYGPSTQPYRTSARSWLSEPHFIGALTLGKFMVCPLESGAKPCLMYGLRGISWPVAAVPAEYAFMGPYSIWINPNVR
jgi:hypothetical protein